MTHPISKHDVDPVQDHHRQREAKPPRPYKQDAPNRLFSGASDLDLDVDPADDYSKGSAKHRQEKPPGWLSRLIDLNLLLMIILIGVPVLVYCIVTSGG